MPVTPWETSILCRVLKRLIASLFVWSVAAPVFGQVIACPTISVTVVEGGSVTIQQPGYTTQTCSPQSSPSECKTACSPQSPGDVFTFTAVPNPNWQFVAWQSSNNGAPETTEVITRGPFSGTYVDLESLQAFFQLDTDGDGVVDDDDQCPSTLAGAIVDAQGCSDSQRDDDDDGVPNAADICPNTPFNESADASGCSASQKDADLDGVNNDSDQCPDTPSGESVDSQGCADRQKDTDSDGVTDDIDECTATPADDDPNEVGCGATQRDTDEDGVNDEIGRAHV